MNSKEILQLTGIRFVASFMVCIFHFNPFTVAVFGERIHGFFSEMHVGVTFFFVLSGFLISYRYYYEEHIDFRRFYGKRIARIFPVYLLLTLVMFGAQLITHPEGIEKLSFYKELFLNLTLLKGFSSSYKFSGILQAWSLTVEETFYLFAPFIFFLLRKNRYMLLIFPVFFLLLGILLQYTIGTSPHNTDAWFGNMEFISSYTFFGRSFEFFCGVALAKVCFRQRNKGIETVRGNVYTASGILLSVVLIFVISLFASPQYIHGIQHPAGILINNILLPICIAVFYYGLIYERTLFAKLLAHPVVVILGKSSYVFYLVHLWVGSFNDNILFVLPVSILISLLLWRFFEEPARRIITSRLAGEQK